MTEFDPNYSSERFAILIVAIVFGLATSAVAVLAAVAYV